MLSLFFSVGICRILRYGSSNTSAVKQQVCPRFFFRTKQVWKNEKM